MLEFKRITRDWFKIGLAAGLLSTIFSLLIGWLKLPLVNVTFSAIEVNVRQAVEQGISTDLGAKVLGVLSGISGFKFPVFVTTLVSALLIVYLGRVLYEWMPFKARTPVGKLTTVLFMGSVVGSLIAAFALKVPVFGILAASLLHFVLISIAIWLLSTKADLFKIPE